MPQQPPVAGAAATTMLLIFLSFCQISRVVLAHDEQPEGSNHNLPDARRGYPYVATPTQAFPPQELEEDLRYNRQMTDREWLTPFQATIADINLAWYTYARNGEFPYCQWHMRQGWNSSRYGLLDKNAVYYLQFIYPNNEDEVLRITGDFPPTMYFSYEIYESAASAESETGASLYDAKIKPKTGKNPFVDPTTTPEEAGTYEIYITKTGKHGFPNELKANVTRSPNAILEGGIYRSTETLTGNFAILVLRLYKQTPWEPLPLNMAIVPPRIQMGSLSDPSKWERGPHWPACPSKIREGTTMLESWSSWLAEQANVNGAVVRYLRGCVIPLGTRGMVPFDPSSMVGSITARSVTARNENSPYMFYCINTEDVQKRGLTNNNIVIHLTGKLHSFPRGLYAGEGHPPLVAEVDEYDTRFISFNTFNPLFAFLDFEGIDGEELVKFYTSSSKNWDGTYSIVLSTDPSAPTRCGLFNNQTDIYLGWRQIEGQGAHHQTRGTDGIWSPAFLQRQILPKLGRQSAADALAACHGPKTCSDLNVVRGAMGEYYPAITAYVCHTDGRREVIEPEPYVPQPPSSNIGGGGGRRLRKAEEREVQVE